MIVTETCNSPQKTKMTQKLTTKGHRTTSNHEQSAYTA